jgi:hypothetical protein
MKPAPATLADPNLGDLHVLDSALSRARKRRVPAVDNFQ